jgi:hypothetical protein
MSSTTTATPVSQSAMRACGDWRADGPGTTDSSDTAGESFPTDGATVSRMACVASTPAPAGVTPSRRRATTATARIRASLHQPAPRLRNAVVNGTKMSVDPSSVPLNPRGATPMIVNI